MTVVATTINNEEIYLGKPTSMVMECEENVPADTLAIIFAVSKRFDEFKFMKLYYKEKLIFNGVVDNHTFIIDENGQFLKLSVRSMAAVLLDNEAMPQIYTLPSVTTIFDRHIKPYGFLGLMGENNFTAKEYTVLKGMNEWDVLYKFCTEVLDAVPTVTVDNYIDIRRNKYDLNEPLKISSYNGKDYICALEEDIDRYNLISDIHIRTKNDGLYSELLTNHDAISRGIRRKRYFNLVGNSNYTISDGEDKIELSKQRSYKIKLQIQGYIDTKVGMKVELNDQFLGMMKGLIISKIKYRLNSNKDIIELTLRKE